VERYRLRNYNGVSTLIGDVRRTIAEEGSWKMVQRSQESVALGMAVRDLRRCAGLSQEELGDRSGMHRTYVGGIERGERNPSWLNIVRLSEALASHPSDLATRAEEYGWLPPACVGGDG